MGKLAAETFEDFIVRLNANPPVDFAMLFPVVLAASDGGDSVAASVLQRAGCELAAMGGIVIERLFYEQQVSVVTHGGVLASSALVRHSLQQELKSRYPEAALLDREVDPARGALARARLVFETAGA
jgi:N-acetylglucosamine kinase-like BadF-type ATPase